MVREGKAYQYACWAKNDTTGKAPKYVKLQADQWLRIADGKDPDAYVDEQLLDKVSKLLKLMIHPDLHCSIYDGMDDYAWLLITAALCTVCREGSRFYELAQVDYKDVKIRYYQTALLEIARKNRKTFYSAVIFILEMLIEPNFSRFFSVAPDLRCSSELYVAINKIIKSSPALYDEVEPAFKILRKQVKCLLNENEYTPLAYSEDRMDSSTAHCYLADEAGAMDSYPIEAMRSSQIALKSKLGIIISTQYPNDNNGFKDEIDAAKKTLDGLMPGSRYFALLYEPDDPLKQGDAWQTDDRCIYQSNPVAVAEPLVFENLVAQRTMAIMYPNKRENFLCKHLNILFKGLGVEGYVDIQKVKLGSGSYPKSWWKDRNVWIGMDLSQTEDNTAVCMVTEEDGVIYAKAIGFIPGNDLRIKQKSDRERVDYEECIRKGECIPCGDEVIDYSMVEHFIIHTIQEEYGVHIVQIGYDRYNAISTVQKLEAAGLECVEIRQHSSVLHPATKWLKEMILAKKFRYDASRLLEINFQNARCTEDTNKNKYVNKKKSTGKVDLVVGIINAMHLLQQDMLYNRNAFVIMY